MLLKSYKWSLFALLLLCFASAILGDSTAEALLLANYDAAMVPRMFLVNAAFLVLFSVFMISAIDRIDRGRFFMVLCLVHCGVLLVVRAGIGFGMEFLLLPLFSYAYVTKILLFTLFWTLANDLVDSRRAGSEFPIVAAGGTLGAIGISFSIPWLLRVIDAQNLLLVWALLVGLVAVVFIPVRASFGKAFMPSTDRPARRPGKLSSIVNDLKLVRREPLLWNMSIFYFVLFFVLLNQHFSFYQHLRARFAQANDLAAFLGYFNGISMVVTFLLQLSIAGLVLKKVGATRSMILLPGALLIAFGTLAYLGSQTGGAGRWAMQGAADFLFWGVVLGMGTRVAFFDAFFSPNFQVFFSSLPQHVRGRGKFSIEGIIKPASIVFASFWLMLVISRISFTLNMIVLTTVCGALIFQTFRIRRRYADSLIAYLAGGRRGKARLGRGLVGLNDEAEFVAALEDKLKSEEFEIQLFIMDILAEMNTDRSTAVLCRYLEHSDHKVRAATASAMTGLNREELKGPLLERLCDENMRVVANAVTALGCYADQPEVASNLMEFLWFPNNRIRANAVVALWPSAGEDVRNELCKALLVMLEGDSQQEQMSALYALSRIGDQALTKHLRAYLERNREKLKTCLGLSRWFVAACSRVADREGLGLLLELAPGAGRVGSNDIAQGVAGMLRNGLSAGRVVAGLPDLDHREKALVLKGVFLAELDLDREAQSVLGAIALDEIRHIYGDWCGLAALERVEESDRFFLLKNAVREESIGERLNNVIYIAAMLDQEAQIRTIIHRLNHENRHIRARACEVLDNVGNIKLNRSLIQLLDSNDPAEHAQRGRSLYGLGEAGLHDAVAGFGTSPSAWVRECAAYAQDAYAAG